MYIVTGGAGFIGSALVWALNRKGIDNILIVDHLGNTDKWKNLRALRYADYMEKDAFRSLLDKGGLPQELKAIVHLGACSATTELDASYLADNNFAYSKELAEYAVKRDIRFLYASSAATYGDGSQGYDDNEDALDTLRPLNMYGYSKQMFDLWARRKGYLSEITGLKFTNVYGPNELHKGDMRSVICKAFDQVRSSGTMKLFKSQRKDYADGEQMRDFLYVKDAVEMVLFLLEHKVDSGIYNIGSGRAESWNSVAAAVFDALKMPKKIEYVDMPPHLSARYQYYTKAEMGKLQKLGYSKTATPLKDAIKDYICNYLTREHYLGDS